MTKLPSCHPLLAVALVGLVSPLGADNHVAVTSIAKEDYTQRKFEHGRPRTETYVFMAGKYYDGATADRSIEKMPFRRIAEYLAPELAKQQYVPCKDPAAADLLLIVHWGTTVPRVSAAELRAQVTVVSDTTSTAAGIERAIVEHNAHAVSAADVLPSLLGNDLAASAAASSVGDEVDRQLEFDGLEQTADQIRSDYAASTNARLLGYEREFRRHAGDMIAPAEHDTLRSDMASERYFIIIRAYELKERVEAGRTRKPAWTIYLNIRSPGHNFPSALNLMGIAAADYFGRATEGVQTANVTVRPGTVTLAPVVILGEQK